MRKAKCSRLEITVELYQIFRRIVALAEPKQRLPSRAERCILIRTRRELGEIDVRERAADCGVAYFRRRVRQLDEVSCCLGGRHVAEARPEDAGATAADTTFAHHRPSSARPIVTRTAADTLPLAVPD